MTKRALAHLRADPAMARLVDPIGLAKLGPRRLPPFQSLTHAIIHQQLNFNLGRPDVLLVHDLGVREG